MSVWDEVRALITTRDIDRLTARMAVLDDTGRKEVARELPGYLKLLRRRHAASSPWERGVGDWAEPMRVAGAGSLGGAAAVAAWVGRRDFAPFEGETPGDTEALVTVISAREPHWQADLVTRLVLRIRDRRSPGLPLALALLRRTGVTPPEHDPLVVGWVSTPPGVRRLREDPLLDVLLPRIFEAQGVGLALREERSNPPRAGSWLGALATLSGEGRISREMLLDGCVRRFLLGGDARELRFFARLHELLRPSSAEVGSRARDYLRLLPTAPGPVADLSLRHLRRLDSPDTPLDPADVAEALCGLLFRAEGGLVRAGLTWLDRILRERPERADELAPALASALGHETYAVQERAVRVAVKYAAHLSPLGTEPLRATLPGLPPDLGRRLAKVTGGEVGPEPEPEVFVPPELPAPEPPAPFPPLPGTVAEFVSMGRASTWQAAEIWLAGFVRFAAEDREALCAALSGRAHRPSGFHTREDWYWAEDWFAAMAAELVHRGTDSRPPVGEPPVSAPGEVRRDAAIGAGDADGGGPSFGDLLAGMRDSVLNWVMGLAGGVAVPDRLPGEKAVSPPHRFLLRRYAEVLAALKADTLPPVLLATPTHDTGHLDPADLVARLEAVEAAGAEPPAADLQQALLRLPRAADPEVVARAGRLTSEAGRRAARRLAEGPVDPEAAVRWKYTEGMIEHYADEREPRAASRARPVSRLTVEPAGLTFDGLLGEVSDRDRGEHGGYLDWWPALLPSHRDVVAAHYLPYLLHSWERPQVRPDHVARLAASDGPAGEPLALLLAFFLARRDQAEGVRLLLSMAARGDLPAAELGRQLTLLVEYTSASLSHATTGLEEAARRGAHREVWEVIREALPHLLPEPGGRPAPGVTDLVALGVTVAGRAGARGEIAALASAAARRSSSRFTRECRRLHDLLARP
ncbi:hypothetical protein FHS43_006445 [Streptosporangium becharense]|uniref:DUF7824 domain-containing protein n=1 Tax=Streptosporangium becharense TaxID=1816182 RepID=A0A7W9IME5_9ACTN|nr:DUF6493 family protein [Streptosporangium becharense]MBB2915125.1 hypothetical protein [Streptosporangium becharense]MBB5822803.1 hypothetical protein [Streptosporangium becharense]